MIDAAGESNSGGHGTRASGESLRLDVLENLQQLDPANWNALLARCDAANLFLRHEFLSALQDTGCAVPKTGWRARFIVAFRGTQLVGALPLYLKSHSRGEYVFDWAWAQAYEQHGLRYYPKLVSSVPFTPVPGSRVLAVDEPVRRALLDAVIVLARDEGCSSAHLLFPSDVDLATARAAGWMVRQGVQFHWQNRSPHPYADFEEFLHSLHRDKRKKIAQERRYVAQAGVCFDALQGTEITSADWDFFFDCYVHTYHQHGNAPYLSRAVFEQVSGSLPEHWLLFVARQDGRRVGASLVALDPKRRTAYGRYWGALAPVRCLHFEACYYQPLQWCIEHGYQRFEGGAQGEHKMARGLLPTETWSAHWLADPRFANAVDHFLSREGQGMAAYVDELREHSPFKAIDKDQGVG